MPSIFSDTGALHQLVHLWRFDSDEARRAFWKRLAADAGFAPFVPRWAAVDALADRPVTVHEATTTWVGCARGIDDRGRLQVKADGRLRCVDAGEVSIRLA